MGCNVHESVLISAVRYALGRRTYVVSETCDAVKENLLNLSPKTIWCLIRDIEECKDYGMQMDKDNWLDLVKELRGIGGSVEART